MTEEHRERRPHASAELAGEGSQEQDRAGAEKRASERPEPGQREHHHVADPAALEDPVHHDVAEHELREEAEDSADGDLPALPETGPEPTGDPRVDAALERLSGVRNRPTAEHVEIYEDIHLRLQDALADIDGS